MLPCGRFPSDGKKRKPSVSFIVRVLGACWARAVTRSSTCFNLNVSSFLLSDAEHRLYLNNISDASRICVEDFCNIQARVTQVGTRYTIKYTKSILGILRVLPSRVESSRVSRFSLGCARRTDYGKSPKKLKHHVTCHVSKKIPRAVLLRSKAHAELPLPAVPTLVWRCRPNSGAGAAAGGDSDILLSRREETAIVAKAST